ncbi:MAG TPA: hypothetical protein VK788_18465 [Terriglobales bacterium]|jgi:hypothetical protein|nr:hypothetical protein [Terriglobales bacterium]
MAEAVIRKVAFSTHYSGQYQSVSAYGTAAAPEEQSKALQAQLKLGSLAEHFLFAFGS